MDPHLGKGLSRRSCRGPPRTPPHTTRSSRRRCCQCGMTPPQACCRRRPRWAQCQTRPPPRCSPGTSAGAGTRRPEPGTEPPPAPAPPPPAPAPPRPAQRRRAAGGLEHPGDRLASGAEARVSARLAPTRRTRAWVLAMRALPLSTSCLGGTQVAWGTQDPPGAGTSPCPQEATRRYPCIVHIFLS